MKTIEVLKAAKELIKDSANWTQGDYKEVKEDRTCYCALGAIGEVMLKVPDSGVTWYGDVTSTQAAKLLREVVGSSVQTHETFAPYNDSHSHSEVMEAFDKAIYLAQVQDGEVVKL